MSQKEYQTISDFINGTLTNKKREEVSKQIKDHSANAESNKMKTNHKKTFDPDKAWNTFHKRIEGDSKSTNKPKPLFRMRNIAASIVFLIGTAVLGYFIVNNYSQAQFTEISSGNSIKEVMLPDGSQLSLNQNSTIIFPDEFSKSDRIVEFSGEAFFDIVKNPAKPFIIQTNKAEVTVLGTSFNVLADEKDNITVTVKTGKVKLSKNKTENIILNPSEAGKIENNKLEKLTNSDKNYLAWKTKCFTYDGEQLSKVIEDFKKVYNVNIVFESEDIGKILIGSDIENKSLNSALDIVCGPDNLKYKQEGNTITISQNNNK